MLNAPTLEKLHALKLDALAAAWTDQQQHADATALAFDERLGLLVEAEWIARENKRLGRALQEAKLKLPQACLEAIDYPARRELGDPRVEGGEGEEGLVAEAGEDPPLHDLDRHFDFRFIPWLRRG